MKIQQGRGLEPDGEEVPKGGFMEEVTLEAGIRK